MRTKLQALVAAATLGVASGGPSALAQPASTPSETQQPATPETSDKPSEAAPAPSISTSLPNPDPGGVRVSLEKLGISYSFTYIGEGLGNLSGGVRRRSVSTFSATS